jgi:hypothetical protein
MEAAILVLKGALYEAEHQEREDIIADIRKRLEDLGADPDNLSDILGE